MKPSDLWESVETLEDNRFDLVYPPRIRAQSAVHWTPVAIARQAAEFLVTRPGTRVLDVGSGPGKFCIVGALATRGRFTGVEQRKPLCDAACSVIAQALISNAEIVHGNVMEIEFSGFDSFYLFNPFEENLETTARIDASVRLSGELYDTYTEHVARQLALAALGTRVATYCGACEEVPLGYECVNDRADEGLKFWEKTRHQPVRAIGSDARGTLDPARLLIRGRAESSGVGMPGWPEPA